MVDHRKLKRRQLIYYLQVLDCRTGELIGRLADITTEGLMLLSPTPVPVNKEFEFKMILPSEVQGDKAVYFDGITVWSRRDVNPDLYDTGVKFIKIAERDIQIIETLIFDYEIPN